MTAPIVLPWPFRSGLEVAARLLFDLGDQSSADFLQPAGEAALVSQDSDVERHIEEGERHLSRQREIVDELERHGRGNSETARIARDLLASFEMGQTAHLNDRAHLLQALREIT